MYLSASLSLPDMTHHPVPRRCQLRRKLEHTSAAMASLRTQFSAKSQHVDELHDEANALRQQLDDTRQALADKTAEAEALFARCTAADASMAEADDKLGTAAALMQVRGRCWRAHSAVWPWSFRL